VHDRSVQLLADECRAGHGCKGEGMRDVLMYVLRYDRNAGVRLNALQGLQPYVAEDVRACQALVELVVRRLKDQGYLNDCQYASSFSSLRRDNQKFGRRRIITDLKAKGVHSAVIEKAVDAAFDGVSEEKLAREYLRKKRLEKPKDQKEAARIFRQLARAGFGAKTIFTILKKWEIDDETLSALESESA
jgi:regulatory protein